MSGDEAAVSFIAAPEDEGDNDEASRGQADMAPSSEQDVEKNVGQISSAIAKRENKYKHEDERHPNFCKHKKHVFVLSNAGKPIYTRYGSDDTLPTLFMSFAGMISFVKCFEDDELIEITAGAHRFVFLEQGSLYFVCVAQTGEPPELLRAQLEYVHAQIFAILTSTVEQIFQRDPGFDLRGLLGGTETALNGIVRSASGSPTFMLDCVRCLKLESPLRQNIARVLHSARCDGLLFAIMMAKNQLIHLLRPKKRALPASDILVLQNFVAASGSLKANETWAPVCLPRYNSKGHLYAHVSYLDEEADLCLVLLTPYPDRFFSLKECREIIDTGLKDNALLPSLVAAIRDRNYSIEAAQIPELRHFLFLAKSIGQMTAPKFAAPYTTRKEQKQLFRMYQHVHARLSCGPHALQLYFVVGERETLLGWQTPEFELLAAFGPLVSKPVAVTSCNRLLRWIKTEEQRLFILQSPVW